MEEVKDELAEIPSEGNLFDDEGDEENEDSQGSQPESNEEVEDPSQEGEDSKDDNTSDEEKVPFHKHPRWQQKEKRIKELEEEVDRLSEFEENVDNRFRSLEKDKTQTELPDWWKLGFGDSQQSKEAYNLYLRDDKARRADIRQEIQQEEKQRQADIAERQRQEDIWVQDELQRLVDNGADIKSKADKNAFLKFAVDNPIRDENNNVDLSKIYGLYEMSKTASKKDNKSVSVKKKLASDSVETKGGKDKIEKEFMTSKDLRGVSFDNLV